MLSPQRIYECGCKLLRKKIRAAIRMLQGSHLTGQWGTLLERRERSNCRVKWQPCTKALMPFEKMAKASRKRTEVAEEMLSIDKQKSIISLFSIQNENSELFRWFMRLSQHPAIRELEKKAGVWLNGNDNFHTQSEIPSASSLRDLSVPSAGAIPCHLTVPVAIHPGADTLPPSKEEPSADLKPSHFVYFESMALKSMRSVRINKKKHDFYLKFYDLTFTKDTPLILYEGLH